ncbi:UNVERIFIED_ORG: hypothetical protein ABRZ91_002674 [Heyndrickxia coagulans]
MMYWKLRIPLLLLVFGVTAGFHQKFPTLFLARVSYFLTSAVLDPYHRQQKKK